MSGTGTREPALGFDDSRRLTGPSRWFAGPAVTLTPRGAFAHDAAVQAGWAARVQAVTQALGWPDAAPQIHDHAAEPALLFAAPDEALFTATEISEWAWERSAAAAGEQGFDLAQPAFDDTAAAAAHFAARAAAECQPALQALRRAAAARGLPLLEDDDEVSVGAGAGSRTWPRAALPAEGAVPWDALHDLPTALVTGSNGKTTTVRMLAAMAQAAGHAAGYCCTEGVFVAGQAAERGDWSGPAGARAVLRHAGVQLAVLETARGGLLRRGLAVRRADVAVVTNIQPDHLGEYGIDSADDLAEVKLTVARALPPGGTLVLNCADATLMAVAARLPHAAGARPALFADVADHPLLAAARDRGAATCGVRDSRLRLQHGAADEDLGAVADLPAALGGAAPHNVLNAAAAALAAHALGLPVAAIRAALARFGADPLDNPGRLERWTHRGATVLIDYAHNPDGLAQLLQVARALRPARLGLLLGQAGNRGDAAIADLVRVAAAASPDFVVVKELPAMLRGRAPGEVPALIERDLLAAGLPASHVQRIDDEEAAARALLAWAARGDVVVLPVHTAAVREPLRALLQG